MARSSPDRPRKLSRHGPCRCQATSSRSAKDEATVGPPWASADGYTAARNFVRVPRVGAPPLVPQVAVGAYLFLVRRLGPGWRLRRANGECRGEIGLLSDTWLHDQRES